MTLGEFLSKCVDTNSKVTIVDNDSEQALATINAGGYESLDDALEARVIKKWSASSASNYTVTLETEPTP